MEKRVLFLFLILLSYSCKDSSKEEVEMPKVPVVITLDQVITSLPEIKSASTLSSADSMLNNFGVLYYIIFDATGKYMHQKKQIKSEESFGIINDELKVGQYTILLFSSTNEINVGSTFSALTSAKVKGAATSGDIYYKKLQINVTEQGLAQTVLLDRVIGAVQIRIKDKIADNVKKIELSTEDETPFFNLSTDKVETITKEIRSTSAIVDDTNRSSFTLGLLLLNDQLPITAVVNIYDTSGKLIKTKKIPNIVNVRGEKTSVEGKLSDFMSAGFTIGYNNTGPMDSTIVNF